jgi:DDE family transposase
LLNQIGVEGRLESSSVGEIDLAIQQLPQAKPGDVLISDRGFTSYRYLAWHQHLGLDYLTRCSSASFAAAAALFRMNRAGRSVVAKLVPPSPQRAELRALGLPLEWVVRFVSVRLPTGALEVLATSLLDEQGYPTQEFLELYHCRWNQETFYGTLKGRLDLENFSGQTVEAVRQDYFATLLLCNLQSALSQPAAQALSQQSAGHKHPQQVKPSRSLSCAQRSIAGFTLQRTASRAGGPRASAIIAGLAGEYALPAQSASSGALTQPFLPFPKTCQKDRLLNLIRLIQWQWGVALGYDGCSLSGRWYFQNAPSWSFILIRAWQPKTG